MSKTGCEERANKRRGGRRGAAEPKSGGVRRSAYVKGGRAARAGRRAGADGARASKESPAGKPCVEADELENWLTNLVFPRVKPTTYESYYHCMHKYILPFFRRGGNLITEEQIRLFIKSLGQNPSLADTYKRKIVSVFRTALKETLKHAGQGDSLLEAARMPSTQVPSVQVFSRKEQQLIEREILRSEDKRALGVLLCFYSGIRLGELCALRWENIDFDGGTLSVVGTVARTKNFEPDGEKTSLLFGTPKSRNSARKIPLPDFLLRLLRDYKGADPDERSYILSGTETPIDPRTFQKLFQKLLERAGVKYRKFHAIRHTFATRAIEIGIDIRTLSEILGHASVTITLNIYAHSQMEQKKIAMVKMNELHMEQMGSPAAAASF